MKTGSYLKVILVCCLIIATGAGYFAYRYLDQVNGEIQKKFNGSKWVLPAIVYARPLELYPAMKLDPNLLEKELQLADYRKETPVTAPGGYFRDEGSFEIYTRGFHFASGFEKPVTMHVTIEDGVVSQIRSGNSGEDLFFVRLDPARIGSFHPQIHEDRLVLKSEEIPELLRLGLIAVEDRAFPSHYGVSPMAIGRAFLANLNAGKTVQGGSTITQQLVKNLFLDRQRTLKRKINEALMAILLDYHYSKDEIMAAYINEVFLGQDGARAIHGFGLASQFYFQKDLGDLSAGQLATLIGMVKGASYFDPRRHPERAKERRDVVLRVFHGERIISDSEFKVALAEPLGGDSEQKNGFNRFPDYLDLVRFQLLDEYQKEDLQTKGLRILTSLDPQVQWRIEDGLEKTVQALEEKKDSKGVEGAVVITKRETGEVLGLVGGRGSRAASFNRALDANRPIGSLVKPAVYLTGLSEGYTLASPLVDSMIGLQEAADGWSPENYDKKEHGSVPLYYALAKSYNLATVRLGLDVGLEKVIETLGKLGCQDKITAYPSLLLGSIDMSPLQVSQMYQTIASGGFYLPLRSIQSVVTQDGELVTRYGLEIEQRFSPALMELLTHGLSRVITEGTARGYPFDPEKFYAGKTGTTDGLRDSWFAGFSNEYSGVVWLGRDDNQPTPFTGSSGALRVWGTIMASLGGESGAPQSSSTDIVWSLADIRTIQGADGQKPGTTLLPFIKGTEPQRPLKPRATGLQTIENEARNLIKSINRIFQ
ncbi:MAG: penicillin-binding protein 1B [Desulforhopalus sp.]|jgi:penicillin-binding protein 1B